MSEQLIERAKELLAPPPCAECGGDHSSIMSYEIRCMLADLVPQLVAENRTTKGAERRDAPVHRTAPNVHHGDQELRSRPPIRLLALAGACRGASRDGRRTRRFGTETMTAAPSRLETRIPTPMARDWCSWPLQDRARRPQRLDPVRHRTRRIDDDVDASHRNRLRQFARRTATRRTS